MHKNTIAPRSFWTSASDIEITNNNKSNPFPTEFLTPFFLESPVRQQNHL
jgi:hypothetical protein